MQAAVTLAFEMQTRGVSELPAEEGLGGTTALSVSFCVCMSRQNVCVHGYPRQGHVWELVLIYVIYIFLQRHRIPSCSLWLNSTAAVGLG